MGERRRRIEALVGRRLKKSEVRQEAVELAKREGRKPGMPWKGKARA